MSVGCRKSHVARLWRQIVTCEACANADTETWGMHWQLATNYWQLSGSRLCLFGGVDFLLLDLAELLDAADVTAVAEGGGQEDLDDVADLVFAEQIGAEAQDVAVVVLAGAAGGDLVMDEGSADAA